jgi:acyl-CoA synthetase (NDP forming)
MAVAGVSTRKQNMGRIILRNILGSGFDKERVYVIRPGIDSIDGVRCVPTIADLPERVDTLVLAVGAEQSAEIMEQVAYWTTWMSISKEIISSIFLLMVTFF